MSWLARLGDKRGTAAVDREERRRREVGGGGGESKGWGWQGK